MPSDSDDEPITLSSHALAALAEFNAERDAHQQQFQRLKASAEDEAASREHRRSRDIVSMDAFTEDWNESQFWYSDETAVLLARELLHGATSDSVIGVVSAPSVFVALRNILLRTGHGGEGQGERPDSNDVTWQGQPRLVLLEHDKRFTVFPEFIFYDFQQPLKLPGELKACMDRIICDPPFLSKDCQTKAALTVRWLMKPPTAEPRLILCTGERMQDMVLRLYRSAGLRTTDYEPVHARGLSNEFLCYANFESPHQAWRWKGGTGTGTGTGHDQDTQYNR